MRSINFLLIFALANISLRKKYSDMHDNKTFTMKD